MYALSNNIKKKYYYYIVTYKPLPQNHLRKLICFYNFASEYPSGLVDCHNLRESVC